MSNDLEHGGSVHTPEAARVYIVWAGSACVIFTELSVMDAEAMVRAADGNISPP